ncbi:GNAT family N-acetyltransferase [Diplocloster agilis]|uniref:GNAT family N-acetyltransferase n=1 Tax=Diplocloster agilis TaxID=2850323 RepID=UPI0023AAAD9B|nr:GNAT family N-acetyltransferase [Diplocloster agilis]
MNISVRKLEGTEIGMALNLAWKVFWEYEAPEYAEKGVQEFYNSIHDPHWIRMLQVYCAFDTMDNDKLAGMLATRDNGCHIALFFINGDYHKRGIWTTTF